MRRKKLNWSGPAITVILFAVALLTGSPVALGILIGWLVLSIGALLLDRICGPL